MRPGHGGRLRAVPALLGTAVLSLLLGVVGLVWSQQANAVTVDATVTCQTMAFPTYAWDMDPDATAASANGSTQLTIAFQDLPGVVPLTLTDAPVTVWVTALVDGTERTLTGTGVASAAANAPIAMPPVSVQWVGETTPLDVEITLVTFDMTAYGTTMGSSCGPEEEPISVPINDVPVDGVSSLPPTSAAPTKAPSTAPTATTTVTVTASPTASASATEAPAVEAVPVTGKVSFGCVLQTLKSPFDYDPTITVSASRPTADSEKVTVTAQLSDIPGLAPVPIENGTMKTTLVATIGGKQYTFKATSTVNAPIYGEVPVPTLSQTITSPEEKLDVAIDDFDFDFGSMSGLEVYSECDLAGSGKLGTMTVGVGDDGTGPTDDGDGSGDTGATGTGQGPAPAAVTSLPKTGPGAPLAVIGLWASALVLLAAAILIGFPGRRRH